MAVFVAFRRSQQRPLPESDLAEWEAAIDEYKAQQGNEELPEDDGNEWS